MQLLRRKRNSKRNRRSKITILNSVRRFFFFLLSLFCNWRVCREGSTCESLFSISIPRMRSWRKQMSSETFMMNKNNKWRMFTRRLKKFWEFIMISWGVILSETTISPGIKCSTINERSVQRFSTRILNKQQPF